MSDRGSLPGPGEAPLLLHNPKCSKSRALRAALVEQGVEVEIREYLDRPLGADELSELQRRLGRPWADMLRPKEAEYTEAGLSADSSDEDLRAALVAHPRLLERPVLVLPQRAAIGRPTEAALDLLTGA